MQLSSTTLSLTDVCGRIDEGLVFIGSLNKVVGMLLVLMTASLLKHVKTLPISKTGMPWLKEIMTQCASFLKKKKLDFQIKINILVYTQFLRVHFSYM